MYKRTRNGKGEEVRTGLGEKRRRRRKWTGAEEKGVWEPGRWSMFIYVSSVCLERDVVRSTSTENTAMIPSKKEKNRPTCSLLPVAFTPVESFLIA